MATLRKWFTDPNVKVDWDTFVLIVHSVDGASPGWHVGLKASRLDFSPGGNAKPGNCAILDVEFSDDYGGPEAPRFIGYDKEMIYFPARYDGATWVEAIRRNVEDYALMNGEHVIYQTPYPGS